MSTSVFALSILYQDMVQRFSDESTPYNVVFGSREPAKAINQSAGRAGRVCFVPGVDGKMGTYAPGRLPGSNPRPLKTFLELASIYCWGFDPTGPNDELLQYEAARYVHDAAVRSLELSARSTANPDLELVYSDAQRVGSGIERTFGFEMRFSLQVRATVPDQALTEVAPLEGDIGVVMGFPSGDFHDSDELIS